MSKENLRTLTIYRTENVDVVDDRCTAITSRHVNDNYHENRDWIGLEKEILMMILMITNGC